MYRLWLLRLKLNLEINFESLTKPSIRLKVLSRLVKQINDILNGFLFSLQLFNHSVFSLDFHVQYLKLTWVKGQESYFWMFIVLHIKTLLMQIKKGL